MSHKVKVEAKDVSQAIEKGLKKLGLRRDQVEVTVLTNPRKGFLGIGARPAVVEVRQKRWVSSNLDAQIYMDVPKKKRSGKGHASRNGRGGRGRKQEDGVREIKRGGRRSYGANRKAEPTIKTNEKQLLPSLEIQNAVVPQYLQAPLQEAKEFLHNILAHMDVKEENLNAWWDEKQHRILLTFDCDHPAIVIGKEGKTLESLQYLATLSLSRHFDKPISVIADTQNYWRKAEDKINADLEYGINQIKNGYSVYRFRPMSAQLRRYIHRAAENNEFVITVSEGEGQWRKVTLRPRPADQPVQKEETVETAPIEAPVAEAVQEQVQSAVADTQAVEETAVEQVQTPEVETAENTQAETVATETVTETVENVQTLEVVVEEQAPVVQEIPAAQEPAAEQPQVQEQAPAEEVAAQAEQPVVPAEQETQTGCACGPLFESVENNETK